MLKELIAHTRVQGGMQKGNITKYQPFPPIDLPDRQWPSLTITTAPIWCSVDLRDGNQALPIPMGLKEKLEMFQLLVDIGFKEIEVGFPSSSQIEFDFVRLLIEGNRIPGDVWQPTPENKIILNLPVTVEVATPNIHADQIEWFCRHLRNRETALVSLHTHNDRGTGVACTELGLLAGADRVEGTLFGNGERTGNVDIITVALNMYTQGVDPGLDFSDISAIRAVAESCTRLDVPMRHPYAGELVFTAFSGSHQDAINKGMTAQNVTAGALWQVPYLPIDPKDIGRSYGAIIPINSQSGKGGVAYVMETEFGYQLPKAMHVELGKIIKNLADECGEELSGAQIFQAFEQEYLHRSEPFAFESFHVEAIAQQDGSKVVACTARISVDGIVRELLGRGNGPIDAF